MRRVYSSAMRVIRGALTCLSPILLALVGAPALADAPRAHPALWRIADADTTIYLFGTIHALPPGFEWFEGPLVSAFDSADELVTEIVEEEPARAQAQLVARAALPRGTSLRGLLTPRQRAAYQAAMAAAGMPLAAFDRFEPWYAAVSLATLPMERAGFARENGAEAVLETRAKALGRPQSALETADYQLALFDTLPLAVQTRYLAEVVRTMPELPDDLAKMVAAWEAGDADTLAKLINADADEPELAERLITVRNRAWAGWIAARMARPGTVFVAVGAGHLAGPRSVQDLLAQRGIASVRVQ